MPGLLTPGSPPAQTPEVLGMSSSPSDPAWSGDAKTSSAWSGSHAEVHCPTVPFHRGPQAASQDADTRGLGPLFPRSRSRIWAQSTRCFRPLCPPCSSPHLCPCSAPEPRHHGETHTPPCSWHIPPLPGSWLGQPPPPVSCHCPNSPVTHSTGATQRAQCQTRGATFRGTHKGA